MLCVLAKVLFVLKSFIFATLPTTSTTQYWLTEPWCSVCASALSPSVIDPVGHRRYWFTTNRSALEDKKKPL